MNNAVVLAQSTTGAWFTRKPLPTARQEIPHAVLNGKIYIPGGFVAGGLATSIVEVFDPAANAWSTIAPLPIRMHHLAFAATNSRLYVLGGYTGNSFLATGRVFEFDFTINNWTEKASMPGARGAAIAAAHNGKIYVIGGRNFSTSGNTSTLEAYSPATNQWYAKQDMPTPRGGLAAAALHGRFYVFGGEIPGVFSQVEEYDPVKNSWRPMTPMPAPRHGIGAATVADTIFIIGGGPIEGFGVSNVTSGFTVSPITAVRDEPKVPRDFALCQNYPNPFNPSTAIRFAVPNAGPATLKIFDALGNEIAMLVNGKVEAGTHEIHWQADRVPAGIYFYRLQTQNHFKTRKLIIIR